MSEETPCQDKFMETEFGTRALNKQNKNKSIVIPKVALENCGLNDVDEMKVSLVQSTNGEKFIKLSSPNDESQKGDDES